MRVALMAVLAVGACARGGAAGDDVAGDSQGGKQDAAVLPADARPDAPPDARPDACVPTVMQLLQNPAFDLTPVGTAWMQQVINTSYPLITAQDGVPEQSAPYKAWLGGLTGGSVTDVLYQDVAIPPLTTQLVLSGYYDVRTSESGSTMYDTGTLGVTQTSGSPIVTILSMSNAAPKTAWTLFNHTFTQNLSGQTIRLRMTSTNDTTNATSFYFDTLTLTATSGCP